MVVAIFTGAADPLDVEETVAGGCVIEVGTDRLASLVKSPSGRPCWTVFRLEAAVTADPLVAETVGGDEDDVGIGRLTSLVKSPSTRPCWLLLRLEAADPLVAETGRGDEDGAGTERLTSPPSARLFFCLEVELLFVDSIADGIVTNPCLVRFVIPLPIFLSSKSVAVVVVT